MKLFGSGRTKEREGIKKQNGMSALIDAELDRGNGNRGARGGRSKGETKCGEEKALLTLCVWAHG